MQGQPNINSARSPNIQGLSTLTPGPAPHLSHSPNTTQLSSPASNMPVPTQQQASASSMGLTIQQSQQRTLSPNISAMSNMNNTQPPESPDKFSQNSLYPNYQQHADAASMPPPPNLPARIQQQSSPQNQKIYSPQQQRKSPQAAGKQDSPYCQNCSPGQMEPQQSVPFQNASPTPNPAAIYRKNSVATKNGPMESQNGPIQGQNAGNTSDYKPLEDASPPRNRPLNPAYPRTEMNQNLMNSHNIPQEGYSPGQNANGAYGNYPTTQLHIDVGNHGQGNYISPDPSSQSSYYSNASAPRSDCTYNTSHQDELCVPQQKKSASVSPSNYFQQFPGYNNNDSRSFDYYEQPWRKSSLAPNMRLNSSHSPNSAYINGHSQYPTQPNPKRSINFNFDTPTPAPQPQPAGFGRKTSFAVFEDKSKENRREGLYHAKSLSNLQKPEKTRSQSLSAAEFFKREAPAKPVVKQNQSLWQHASGLRSNKNSIAGVPPTKSQLGMGTTPYTPPPMLMPKRSGTGLYWSIRKNSDRKLSTLVLAERKQSALETTKRRMGCDMNTFANDANGTETDLPHAATPGTSAALQHNDISNDLNDLKERKKSCHEEPTSHKTSDSDPLDLLDCNYPLDIEKARCSLTGRKPFTRPPMDNRANAPQRKNGLFLSGIAKRGKESQFVADLEALRKESGSSLNSTPSSRKMSIMTNQKPSIPSIVQSEELFSVDEPTRKTSSSSDYYEYLAPESDVTPHINFGKNFQARVKKWASREVTEAELAAIPDRDEMVFDSKVIEHLPDKAVAAYEALACSHAIPRPGRNKELALHILMENQGNIQSAVMDLLRSDTLDWEQYPIIYNNNYTDTDRWLPEEIAAFQDAIYKSEKDFHQVAMEFTNRTVKQCVAFYYTWKKACPDDYRKLRNLRRKRMLLEQQLDVTSFDNRQRTQSENQRESSEDEISEAESDMTGLSSISRRSPPEKFPRLQSPAEREKPIPDFPAVPNPEAMPVLSKPEAQFSQTAYPWLHDEMFPSPASSSNGNYSQPPSVSNIDLFNGGDSLPPMPPTLHHKPRPATTKKGAQPSADGFFHCRLCDKRFEKVKSLNAHMKSHAMKARAEAEAQQQFQQKQQNQQQQNILAHNSAMNGGNQFNLALEVARLQQQRLQQQQEEMSRPQESPTTSGPMGLMSPQQQQQQQLLRLMAAQNAFNAPDQVSAAMTQLGLNAAAAAAMAVTQAQNPLGNVLQLPNSQAASSSGNPLEQLHLQQNLQHSATIMP
ncbi:unnamed protein product [Bursaphelenchus xylophilus]|uniref:(pine wood nematode) hypothetical protein n=1 Tax=Bursaphelenchus xylophilus TaxID=6326 RepID=A0A1I7S8H8_BURXY|nr:unnamed protein product [Bursaphelenchus xylophilus]CAG9121103.1 unnamed protein product [Bursaphelenchus xylophilus]